jgi:glycogen operon protein
LASRFTGSSDLCENTTRRPYASINFITAHDGYTLNDLVSFNEKQSRPTEKKIETAKATTDPGTPA